MSAAFRLKNEGVENWTPTSLLEQDPMQNGKGVCDIVLEVDFEDRDAIVETHMRSNSGDMRVSNGLKKTFMIPKNVDAEAFPEFFEEKVRPILETLGKKFETEWDGRNYVGRFVFDEDPDVNMETVMGLLEDVDNTLKDSPTHSEAIYTEFDGSFGSDNEFLDEMNNADIDFMDLDLDDMDMVKMVRENIEDVVYVMSDEQFQKELKWMQDRLEEEGV